MEIEGLVSQSSISGQWRFGGTKNRLSNCVEGAAPTVTLHISPRFAGVPSPAFKAPEFCMRVLCWSRHCVLLVFSQLALPMCKEGLNCVQENVSCILQLPGMGRECGGRGFPRLALAGKSRAFLGLMVGVHWLLRRVLTEHNRGFLYLSTLFSHSVFKSSNI